METLTIEKERILELAKEKPELKKDLQTLFPEAFSKQVYFANLIETFMLSVEDSEDVYQKLHDNLPDGKPFVIRCLGENHFVYEDADRRWGIGYYGDYGLKAYDIGVWNTSNKTIKV